MDALIDVDDDESVSLSLFSRMIAGITKQRAERVFLRLDADSNLSEAARKAGFFQYARETLYRLDEPPPQQLTEVPWRAREKSDLMGMFQLYSRPFRRTSAQSKARPSASGRRRRSRGEDGRRTCSSRRTA